MKITNAYLSGIVRDARSKVSSQHAINKENLIKICKELLELRQEVKYLESRSPAYTEFRVKNKTENRSLFKIKTDPHIDTV